MTGWVTLNAADLQAVTYPSFAGWDKGDIDIFMQGMRGRGVLSGGEVTATDPASGNLVVAPVVYRYGDAVFSCAGGTITPATHATLPRLSLIIASASSAYAPTGISVVNGTAAAALAAGQPGPAYAEFLWAWIEAQRGVALCAVYLDANDTAISGTFGATNQLLDRRVFVPPPARITDLTRPSPQDRLDERRRVLETASAPRFVDVIAREMGTSLEVLHDHTDGTGSTTADKRIGGSGRGGTFTGNYTRGVDSSLDRGMSKATRLGSGAAIGNVAVDGAGTLNLGYVFTYAIVVRFRKFGGASALVRRAGTAFNVQITDEGTSAKITLVRATTAVVVSTSLVAISDTWQDHLIIVSLNGSGSVNPRIVIDGLEGHVGAVSVTDAGAPTVFTIPGVVSTDSFAVSAFAAWSRQITPAEESRLWAACQLDYKPRFVPVGVHSGIGTYAEENQRALIDHDGDPTGLAARVNRFGFRHGDVQFANGSAYDWDRLEYAVDRSLAWGMRCICPFETMPAWLTGGADEWAIHATQATFQAHVDEWCLDFVIPAVRRFKDRVRWWECWNEPNLKSLFWKYMSGTPSDTQHAQDVAYLMNAVRQAILSEDSAAQVATGAITSWAGVGAGSITGEAMLRNLHANGLSTLFTRYGMHPYNYSAAGSPLTEQDNENNCSDVLKMWDVLVELGRNTVDGVDTLIDVTECSWFDGNLTAAKVRDLLALYRDYFSRRLGVLVVFIDADRSGGYTGMSTEWVGSGMGFTPWTSAIVAGSTLTTLNATDGSLGSAAASGRAKVGVPGRWQVFTYAGKTTAGNPDTFTGVSGLKYIPPVGSVITNELVRRDSGDEFRKFALAYDPLPAAA